MKEYKVESFLYMSLGTTEKEIEEIICSRFNSVSINEIEVREHEVATDFDIIFNASSTEEAENKFLNAFNGYDVDNYIINEF